MAVKQLSDGNSDGTVLGQSTTDLLGFYGNTAPVSRRAAAIQASSFISVSTNATVGSAIAAFNSEVAQTFINLGFWKGAA